MMTHDFFGGLKPHWLMHFVFYKSFYGADRRIIDTELSECFHKFVVNEVFETTSKNVAVLEIEMIKAIQKRCHSLSLHDMIAETLPRRQSNGKALVIANENTIVIDKDQGEDFDLSNDSSDDSCDEDRDAPGNKTMDKVLSEESKKRRFKKQKLKNGWKNSDSDDRRKDDGETIDSDDGEKILIDCYGLHRVVNNFGNVRVEYVPETSELVQVSEWSFCKAEIDRRMENRKKIEEQRPIKKEKTTLALHPMMTLKVLGEMLENSTDEDCEFLAKEVQKTENSRYGMKLLKGISMIAPDDLSAKEDHKFYVHADQAYTLDRRSDYRKQQRSVFSFVQVHYEKDFKGTEKPEIEYAQVLGLIAFEDLNVKHDLHTQKNPTLKYAKVYACVCLMEESATSGKLPFRTYSYQVYGGKQLWCTIIDIRQIVMPAFMVGTEPNNWQSKQTLTLCKKLPKFYCLPYEQAFIPVNVKTLAKELNKMDEGQELDDRVLLDDDRIDRLIESLMERLDEASADLKDEASSEEDDDGRVFVQELAGTGAGRKKRVDKEIFDESHYSCSSDEEGEMY